MPGVKLLQWEWAAFKLSLMLDRPITNMILMLEEFNMLALPTTAVPHAASSKQVDFTYILTKAHYFNCIINGNSIREVDSEGHRCTDHHLRECKSEPRYKFG